MTKLRACLLLVVGVGACATVKTPAVSGSGGDGASATGGGSGGVGADGSGGRVSLPDGSQRDGGTFTAEAGEDASCGFESFDLRRKPVNLFVVLDRSASMKDDSKGDDANVDAGRPSKWSQVIPALTEVIRGADRSIAWGLKTFPEDVSGSDSDCVSASVSDKIDVVISPMNGSQTASAVEAALPEGDGTPTGAAVGVATGYLTVLSTDDRKYILLATDGEPSCGGGAGSLVKDSSRARADAVAAVEAAAGAGVHTFVIGVATTKSSATSTLNLLAVAGQEPRRDPDPAATWFYLASTKDELVSALQAIVTPIASSCVFALSKPPPDPSNIGVKVAGQKAPQDPQHANGWDYSDAGHTEVEVYGAWCDTVKQNADTVQIVLGCPGFVIP